MKKIILTTLAGVAASLLTLSPSNAQVREEARDMSLGRQTALVLELPNTDEKFANKIWQDYMNDFYDSKVKWNRKTGEWLADDAEITALGKGQSVDLYTVFKESKNAVEIALWVDLGSEFLSSRNYPERYTDAEKMLIRYSLEVAKASVKVDLDNQEKELSRLENEMRKLQNANDRYHKEIEKARDAIRKAEEEIAKNEKDQEATQDLIELQKKTVEDVKKKLNNLK
ncbi:MAG: hypothetical protein H6562_00795 [Lewinellaceae bacterium]|nr:hypothetical protein [Lewinella sp.]MCB9277424.1 hypothetical protein [Lewinellaceae bacterium]